MSISNGRVSLLTSDRSRLETPFKFSNVKSVVSSYGPVGHVMNMVGWDGIERY